MYVNQSEETSLPQNNFIGYSKRKKGAAVRDAWGGGGFNAVSRSGAVQQVKADLPPAPNQKIEFRHDFSNPGSVFRAGRAVPSHNVYCNLETSNRSSLTTMTHNDAHLTARLIFDGWPSAHQQISKTKSTAFFAGVSKPPPNHDGHLRLTGSTAVPPRRRSVRAGLCSVVGGLRHHAPPFPPAHPQHVPIAAAAANRQKDEHEHDGPRIRRLPPPPDQRPVRPPRPVHPGGISAVRLRVRPVRREGGEAGLPPDDQAVPPGCRDDQGFHRGRAAAGQRRICPDQRRVPGHPRPRSGGGAQGRSVRCACGFDSMFCLLLSRLFQCEFLSLSCCRAHLISLN